MRPLIDTALAFAATAAGCAVLAWALPLQTAPFGTYMTRRGLRMLGRTGVVLAVIGAAVGPLDARPAAVLVGALAAWLLAAGLEARRLAQSLPAGDSR